MWARGKKLTVKIRLKVPVEKKVSTVRIRI